MINYGHASLAQWQGIWRVMRMGPRDPLTWSFVFPWRPMGVTVRVHILFPLVALGILLWVATSKQFAPGLWAQSCVVLGILFVSVLAHELGHVWVSRGLGGTISEILIWPLGGLVFPELPPSPWTLIRTALAGPLINLVIAVVAGSLLIGHGFIPPLNPLSSPLNPRMYHWPDGVWYFSRANPGEFETWYYRDTTIENSPTRQVDLLFEKRRDGTVEIREASEDIVLASRDHPATLKSNREITVQPARITRWPWVLSQVFLVNWFLLLVNLLPAFPLDGAKIAQGILSRQSDYRTAIAQASYLGFLIMLAVGVYAIAVNELLPALLALVIYSSCRRQLTSLEEVEEKAVTEYDFSQGYTSLERDDDESPETPPAPPAQTTWLQRWQQRRAEARNRREQAQREADERRLDELLDKILTQGRQSLTAEELRFLTAMSARYPNRK